MRPGAVAARDETSLLSFYVLKSLGNVRHALDAGGIALRTDQHEVVVHHRKAFHAFTLGKEFFFSRLGMHEHHVSVAAPCGIKRLASALRQNLHSDSGLLLKDRQQVLEQAGVLRRRSRCHHNRLVLGVGARSNDEETQCYGSNQCSTICCSNSERKEGRHEKPGHRGSFRGLRQAPLNLLDNDHCRTSILRGDGRYSAATFAAGSTTSTRAAQYLNSGILPNGSSAGLVRRLAAASTKANGINTTPSGMASSWRAANSTTPRRVATPIGSPRLRPSLATVPRRTPPPPLR